MTTNFTDIATAPGQVYRFTNNNGEVYFFITMKHKFDKPDLDVACFCSEDDTWRRADGRDFPQRPEEFVLVGDLPNMYKALIQAFGE